MGCSASRPITVITNKAQENHHQITKATTSESSNTSSPNPSNSTKTQPKAFSLSTPLIHHPPIRKGDTHHLVSLTSTTYGYASLLSQTTSFHHHPPKNDTDSTPSPRRYSLSPDSVINTWELMRGLDDDKDFFDLRRIKPPVRPESCRFESNHWSTTTTTTKTKPLWQHLSEESLLSKMDPNVAATYRRAQSSRQLAAGIDDEHSKALSLGGDPDKEDRVVVYFTSLRGVRKTHEDCREVRAILRGAGVAVDERDVSMDAELRAAMDADGTAEGPWGLPQVFVRGRRAGGAEEVRRMHESGQLAALLEGLPRRRRAAAGPGGAECGACGDVRFVPCRRCSGSRKVFVEEEGELRRCQHCNENGLTRCPACCC